ncbi:MAG: amino acid ABC transporter permease [Thermodesulfobacteriota bacterium]
MRARITGWDVLVALLVAAGAVWFFYRVEAQLHYGWNWGVIPQYLFRYDGEAGGWVPNLLMQGLFNTLRLSVWGILLATLLGTAAGLCRVSRDPFTRLLGRLYVEFIRNLPPLVLIFLLYYFIGEQIVPGLRLGSWIENLPETLQGLVILFFAPPSLLSPFLAGLVTLAIFEGAYIAEIVRAGIQSVERGQWEAAYSLGLSRAQTLRRVILPQAVRRILPPLAGQFISTVKDSAIVSVISIQDLTFQGLELMSSTYLTFEIWITVTVLYLFLTLSLSLAVSCLEARLRLGKA